MWSFSAGRCLRAVNGARLPPYKEIPTSSLLNPIGLCRQLQGMLAQSHRQHPRQHPRSFQLRCQHQRQHPPPDQPYVPNDPLYLTWQWYLQRINASRALALVDDGTGYVQPPGEIIVGVIDSGVDFSHPEFQNRLLNGFNYVATSADPDLQTCKVPTESLTAPQDDFGHGTHVTGLIAAGLNNGSGIAGIAPFAKIQPLKMLDNIGRGQIFDLAGAITYATTCLGVEIINMSLEVPASFIDGSPALGNTLHTAIIHAHERNVLMVVAGGNQPANPLPYPAAYPEVMAVAALGLQQWQGQLQRQWQPDRYCRARG